MNKKKNIFFHRITVLFFAFSLIISYQYSVNATLAFSGFDNYIYQLEDSEMPVSGYAGFIEINEYRGNLTSNGNSIFSFAFYPHLRIVHLTNDADGHALRRELQRKLTPEERDFVIFRMVEYSLAELRQAKAEIDAMSAAYELGESPVVSTAIAIEGNWVEVLLLDTRGVYEDWITTLKEEYGDMLKIELTPSRLQTMEKPSPLRYDDLRRAVLNRIVLLQLQKPAVFLPLSGILLIFLLLCFRHEVRGIWRKAK